MSGYTGILLSMDCLNCGFKDVEVSQTFNSKTKLPWIYFDCPGCGMNITQELWWRKIEDTNENRENYGLEPLTELPERKIKDISDLH